jgi:hypothetical protein
LEYFSPFFGILCKEKSGNPDCFVWMTQSCCDSLRKHDPIELGNSIEEMMTSLWSFVIVGRNYNGRGREKVRKISSGVYFFCANCTIKVNRCEEMGQNLTASIWLHLESAWYTILREMEERLLGNRMQFGSKGSRRQFLCTYIPRRHFWPGQQADHPRKLFIYFLIFIWTETDVMIFYNIFAEKFSENIGAFCSNYC